MPLLLATLCALTLPLPNALIVAKADKKTNTVRVTCDKDAHGLYVLVDEHLLDPKKEITVLLNEKQVFKGLAQPSMATVLSTGARGDPELAYTSRIPLF